LHDLADGEFSGVVRAGGAELFMTKGVAVGVRRGSIDSFEDASGTQYVAPTPALPLLAIMQERSEEVRAQYYTEKTALSEVDRTLGDGGFTGYIELSENVLSGDYYLVYHRGRSMSVAYVGNRKELVEGDEAFDLADDEVGIYEVNDVDLDVRDVPSPDGPGDSGGTDAAIGDADSPDPGTESADPEADAGTGPSASGAEATDAGTDATGDTGVDATTGAGVEPTDADAGAAGDAGAGAAGDAGAGAAEDAGADTAGDAVADAADGQGVDVGEAGSESTGSSEEPPTAGTSADEPTDEVTEAEPGAAPPGGDRRERPADDADGGVASGGAPAGGERSSAGATDGSGTATDVSSGGSADRRGRSEAPQSGGGPPAASGTPDDGSARSQAQDSGPRTGITGDDAEVLEDEEPTTAGEEAWREATTIPSLDPDRTAEEPPTSGSSSERSSGQRRQATTGRSGQSASERGQSGSGPTGQSAPEGSGRSPGQRSGQGASARTPQPASDGQGSSTQQGRSPAAQEDVDDTFEQEVLEREDRIDRLQQRLSNLEGEREDLVRERNRLAEAVEELEDENETLRAEVRRLEREVEELESASAGAGGADAAAGGAGEAGAGSETGAGSEAGGSQALDARTALGGTDLFVRYESKSEPTLEDVHGGAVETAAVNENLRLDLHTRFDADAVTVGGEPFREFLEETMGYRFVAWLVRDLPFEIRDTGQQSALRDLYDALPEIDRVEFDGTVELAYQDGGEAVHEEETFDVVVRDRMGEPLVVANLNDSRDPATGRMLVDLQEAASRVKEVNAALVGAFFVTRSFFEPEALETASEATSGSLLSRDSRRSYVKLSRKQGYHLCLVEARGDDLHLNVPEL